MATRVTGIREARAAATALRLVDADVRREVQKGTRSVVNPLWKKTVEGRAKSAVDQRVLAKGSRVNVGAEPSLVGASSTRALTGGLVPSESWAAREFGAKRNEKKTYSTRSPKGKAYRVTRRTKRQLPDFKKTGRVLTPAKDEIAPRVFSLWTQTTLRLIFDALRKGE